MSRIDTRKWTFSVFTPTYNRAFLLPRVYQSLREQTLKDFEWIVVDDGSEDNTAETVHEYCANADFTIRYYRQTNSGKHVAINRAIEVADGQFLVILDDDDWLHPTALERMLAHWNSIPEQERGHFVGVVGLFAHSDGTVVGKPFPYDKIDSNAVEIRTIYRAQGDKFGMHVTDILRQYPFPTNLGKFVPEGLIWNRIAVSYRERYVNEVFAFKEYRPGGLSARSVVLRARNPDAACLYYKEFAELRGLYVPHTWRFRAFVNYVRFGLHKGRLMHENWRGTSKILIAAALPFGYLAYLRDRMVMKGG
jgi:glycosyltransferase involved in cell wall biosynthesis